MKSDVRPTASRKLVSSALKHAMSMQLTRKCVSPAGSGKCLGRALLLGVIIGLGLMLLVASATAQPGLRVDGGWMFEDCLNPIEATSEAAKEGAVLDAIIVSTGPSDVRKVEELLEQWATDNPRSMWTPSLLAHLAYRYKVEGRYTRALPRWEAVWEATKQYEGGQGKRIADYTLANWTGLLAELGRTEELAVILEEVRGRQLMGAPRQLFEKAVEVYGILRKHPAVSYRCGWLALDALAKSERRKGMSAQRGAELYQENDLLGSSSFRALARVAREEQWPLVGIQRPEGAVGLPIPSIMHLTFGHYVALLSESQGSVWVYDSMFGNRSFPVEALEEEASGRFLVPAGRAPAGWRVLSDDEMGSTVGRCWFSGWNDGVETDCESCDEGACPPGLNSGNGGPGSSPSPGNPGTPPVQTPGGCGTGGCGPGGAVNEALGYPRWHVTEPNVNLWLVDVPVQCQPAFGPVVPFRLVYKQRDIIPPLENVFCFGAGWNSRWRSYAETQYWPNHYRQVTVFLPGGGRLPFSFPSDACQSYNYEYNCRLTVYGNDTTLTSVVLDYPDGRQYVYDQTFGSKLFMTRSVDRQGFATRFNYGLDANSNLLLATVADQSGATLYTLGYTNSGVYVVVSSVTSRFGQTATLVYDDSADLLQIGDAAGMASTIVYDYAQGVPQNLYTPYGMTSFDWSLADWSEGGYRYVRVTEPNGGMQMYLFDADCTALWSGAAWMPTNLPASLVPASSTLPSGTRLDTDPSHLNSFYWNQKESVGLPADLTLFTTNHMNKARMRHWLNSVSGHGAPDMGLSFEVLPSQSIDGSGGWGGITFYDYPGKYAEAPAGDIGTNIQPSLIARKLPGGTTWYRSFQRNSFGLATSMTETYGVGTPSTRTYSYTYASNGQDLTDVYRPGGELVEHYSYTNHQVLTRTRYPDGSQSYTDSWSYLADGRPSTFTSAAGLTRTYTYSTSCNGYTGYLSGFSYSPVSGSESFTWNSGGYIGTHQDARGLTRTFTRDGLGRLTRVDYPAHDGLAASSEYYSYTLQNGEGFNTSGYPLNILEQTGFTDRLGKVTRYERDPLGRLSKLKDPLNHTTSYTYCGCGGPETITDGRNKVTTYTYNNAGWKTGVLYGDNTSESFTYDAFGRMVTRTDSLGTRTYSYNNQGLMTNVSCSFGSERTITHNIHDQPTTTVDANGVSITQTFDRLGRVLSRAVPGQGTEAFLYSARGLTNYTGSDSKVTQYLYDEALRKTREITPKNEQINYGYNAAGDLRTLTDGRSKTTTWTYDIEGLVRAKQYHGQSFTNITYTYDRAGRVATRKFWSSLSTGAQTSYTYDDAGNLTFIDYPSSSDVTFTYNEVNKLNTMATVGLGTTTFKYTDAENLNIEYGLWTSDGVTNTYHASAPRLRTSLTVAQPAGYWFQTYAYDAADRLQTIAIPAGTFTYTYKGPGTVWTNLALPTSPSGGAITNAYDTGGRLTSTRLKSSTGVVLNKHDYLYNGAGQRQRHTITNDSYTTYGYDDDAQLISSLGYTSGGVPVAAEQLGFGYDAGWNMTNRSVNGSATAYTLNDVNQFSAGPQSPYSYDANGNLTSYFAPYGSGGIQRTCVYDDENRLISVYGGTVYRTDFAYDGLSRMRVRTDYTWTGSAWAVSATTRYIYDGMRVVQERDGSNVPTVTYTRGKDLSGSLEGVGGIGGLLARSHGYSGGSWSTHNFYHADGLGNITYLMSSGQAMMATYKYDPYGRMGSSGSLAQANTYRFSSKESLLGGQNSAIYYYGYRFYDPVLQRWLNRDPIGSEAIKKRARKILHPARVGSNLYPFGDGCPIQWIDPDGKLIQAPGFSPEVLEECRQEAADVYHSCVEGVKCFFQPIGDWMDMFENNVDIGCTMVRGIAAKLACLAAKAATRTAKGFGGAAKLGALAGCGVAGSNAYQGCLAGHTPPGQSYPIFPTPP